MKPSFLYKGCLRLKYYRLKCSTCHTKDNSNSISNIYMPERYKSTTVCYHVCCFTIAQHWFIFYGSRQKEFY